MIRFPGFSFLNLISRSKSSAVIAMDDFPDSSFQRQFSSPFHRSSPVPTFYRLRPYRPIIAPHSESREPGVSFFNYSENAVRWQVWTDGSHCRSTCCYGSSHGKTPGNIRSADCSPWFAASLCGMAVKNLLHFSYLFYTIRFSVAASKIWALFIFNGNTISSPALTVLWASTLAMNDSSPIRR